MSTTKQIPTARYFGMCGPSHSLAALLVCVTGWLWSDAPAAGNQARQYIEVVSMQGDVKVTSQGIAQIIKSGTVLVLPAQIVTGASSSLELHQGRTTIAIAANTQVDIPVTAIRGDLIERVVQTKGNVFYNVDKRGAARKLRVETPYLVAVVKGTQFNVAAQDSGTTISLFEGRLGIHTADGSDEVDLEAGEIAIFNATDKAIRVQRLDTSSDADLGAGRTSNPGTGTSADTALVTDQVGVSAGADLTAGMMDFSADASLGAAGVGADLGTDIGADLGSGTVDLSADTGVEAGGAGIDLDADMTADLGGVDLAADVGLDAGDLTADASADLGIDLSEPGLDAGVDLGVGDAQIGADAGVDLGSGAVDLGADLGGTDVEVGIDLGDPLDGGADTSGEDSGGLLGGLLGG